MIAQFLENVSHTHSSQGSMQELRAALMAEVATLFGVLRGSMPGDPEYGLGDVTRIYESRQGAGAWCAETQAALRRYVPKIHHPRVSPVPSDRLDLTFRVRIEGWVVVNGRPMPVAFEAAVAPRRAWEVI
ncbi:GPW/gp25 family protein [Pendulispora albinea]|uniref:IraD/Gp25-like domain-containing protein n=1 Tax=Pendulispora albinea TaxID=2741071 RepID=A0ABZ2M3G4_9BACT